MNPEVLLYDEPTTGLDPVNANVINRLIARLQGEIGATSVIVTHDVESAFYLGDRIVLLAEGKVQAHGTPTQLRESTDPIRLPKTPHRSHCHLRQSNFIDQISSVESPASSAKLSTRRC